MFTGLIEDVGEVMTVEWVVDGQRLVVASSLAGDLSVGESVATNGVCLTVVAREGDTWAAEVSPETLRVTALATLRPGSLVNLERSLAVGDRLGGHIVQGHVDATGRIETVREEGDFRRLTVSFPDMLAPYFIEKGSVAMDGISLTVASLGAGSFDVQIVPHTWAHTNLSSAVAGTLVNLECDIVGKYVLRGLSLGYTRP